MQMVFFPLQLQFFSLKLMVGEATLALWPATILPRLGMVRSITALCVC